MLVVLDLHIVWRRPPVRVADVPARRVLGLVG
jgi:hypothetical protein